MAPIVGIVASLLALTVLGTFEAVDYNLNGMIYMCQYRAVLNLLVVAGCSLCFFVVLAAVHCYTACQPVNQQQQLQQQRQQKQHQLQHQLLTDESEDEDEYHEVEYERRSVHGTPARNTPVPASSPRAPSSSAGGGSSDDRTNSNSTVRVASRMPLSSSLSSGRRVGQVGACACATRLFWYFLAACCDAVSLYVSMLVSSGVTSSLRAILQQATIPFSIVLSIFVLQRRYSWGHGVAAGLILAGIVACLSSVVLSRDQTSNPVYGLVYTLSCIPLALGACLKEWILTHPKRPDDIHTVNAATAGFQLVLSVLLYPVAVLLQDDSVCLAGGGGGRNASGGSPVANVSAALTDLWDGVRCGLAGLGPAGSNSSSSNTSNSSPAVGFLEYEDGANSSVSNMSADALCANAVITTWLAIITICGCVFGE
jgi:hypothetical protein